jgi:hypothetical protein
VFVVASWLQHDSHISNMSVAETVNFAHTCHSGFGQPEFNLTGELCKAKVCWIRAEPHTNKIWKPEGSALDRETRANHHTARSAELDHTENRCAPHTPAPHIFIWLSHIKQDAVLSAFVPFPLL